MQKIIKIIFFTLILFSNIVKSVVSYQAYSDLERSKTFRQISSIIHIEDEQKKLFSESAKEFYESGLKLKNEKIYDLAAQEFKRSLKIYLCLVKQYSPKNQLYLKYQSLIKSSFMFGLDCYNICLKTINDKDLQEWLFNKKLNFLSLVNLQDLNFF